MLKLLIMAKKCSKCKIFKKNIEFKKHRCHADGLSSQCKQCISEYRKTPEVRNRDLKAQRIWRKKNPLKEKEYCRRFRESDHGKRYIKDYQIKRHYNCDLETYEALLKSQNFCCAICNRHESNFKKQLSIDHDHETKIIRGLLCKSCNIALGEFRENISILETAISYLLKHKKLRLTG